jgi:hypothetical protein
MYKSQWCCSEVSAEALYRRLCVCGDPWFSIHQLRHNPSLPWKYGIAVLPVVPLLFVPVAVVQFLREQDELQRKMQVEALAIGFTASAVITLTYGFLENAGVPRLSWVWVWPVMAFFWCIGLVVAHRRYR